MAETSDEELLIAFRHGDSAAFDSLFGRYRVALFNFVLRWVRDRGHAEELYQDIWIKVIERSGDFRGDAKFSTWAYSIARNACVDHQRRMKIRRHRSLDAVPDGAEAPMIGRVADTVPSTEDLAVAGVVRGRIANAVETLPDEQREVFLLRQLQGMRFHEIAEVVGVPVNTVKSRMRYALDRMRSELEDLYDATR